MVLLADFQPRAKTNVSHQQPMFHMRICHSVKVLAQPLQIFSIFKVFWSGHDLF